MIESIILLIIILCVKSTIILQELRYILQGFYRLLDYGIFLVPLEGDTGGVEPQGIFIYSQT